jgi:hypothetical protein
VLEQPIVGSLGACRDEEGKQRRHTQILHREAAATSVLTEGLGDEALSRARRSGDEQRLVGAQPSILCQLEDLVFA